MATARTMDEIAGKDFFDSRDIIERMDDLEAIENLLASDEPEDAKEAAESIESEANNGETPDETRARIMQELTDLRAFADEASGYSEDFSYGVTFIRDTYWLEYAQELAEEIGAIDRDASWPMNRIDWDAAADDLKMDYTSITFGGYEYWYR